MAKFIKKPVVVEAEQYTGNGESPGDSITHLCRQNNTAGCPDFPHVHTMTGDSVRVRPGDWIIREPGGVGAYPCAPQVFELTYSAYVELPVPVPVADVVPVIPVAVEPVVAK